eukprot:NODE_845_length_3752_cov_0.184780.p4 type:complete len:101 gc:universal NODE_845_length_3752_cov_0.184780:2093-1791(-)
MPRTPLVRYKPAFNKPEIDSWKMKRKADKMFASEYIVDERADIQLKSCLNKSLEINPDFAVFCCSATFWLNSSAAIALSMSSLLNVLIALINSKKASAIA